MKPMNFPGRKNARRKGALARFPKYRDDEAAMKEQLRLHERIVPDAVARAVRTKKDRSHQAKIAR